MNSASQHPTPNFSDWHQPGQILLISCYEMGHQPIGLALPLGALVERGYQPAALDLAVDRLEEEKVRQARFIGISVPMHTALRIGAQVVRRVRELNPGCHICVFGLYASLNEEYLLQHGANSCIGGESILPLMELVDSLAAGRFADGPGISSRTGTSSPYLGRPQPLSPDRRALPSLDRYARLEHQGQLRIAGYTEATRGCLHHCRHCPIPPVYAGRLAVVPAESVLDDIRQQVDAGAEHITFGDPDFLNGPRHSLAILRRMHEAFPDLTFDCTIKVEHILERAGLFPELRDLGCLFVVTAVESLSDRVLQILDKGHTRHDVERALVILDRAGIAMRPTWVPFTPWTTREDYLEILEFLAARDLVDHVDPVQLSIRLLVPPGSLLLDHPEMQPHLGPLDPAAFSFTWSHPDPPMDHLQQEISRLVEQAAAAGEDSDATFQRIGAAAQALLAPRRPLSLRPARARPKAPRLTEPWFC